MGQKASSSPSAPVTSVGAEVDVDTKPKRRNSLLHSFKSIVKVGICRGRMRRKKHKKQTEVKVTNLPLLEKSEGGDLTAPNESLTVDANQKRDKKSKPSEHFSKISLSKESIKARKKVKTPKNDSIPPSPDPTVPVAPIDEGCSTPVDPNNNQLELVRKVLSPEEDKEGKSPEEIYRQNLHKFERLVAITATTSSDDEDSSDCFDENGNFIGRRRKKPIRISKDIHPSRQVVEVDIAFADWVSNKSSSLLNKFRGKKDEEEKEEEVDTEVSYFSSDAETTDSKGYRHAIAKHHHHGHSHSVTTNKLFHVNNPKKKGESGKNLNKNNKNTTDTPANSDKDKKAGPPPKSALKRDANKKSPTPARNSILDSIRTNKSPDPKTQSKVRGPDTSNNKSGNPAGKGVQSKKPNSKASSPRPQSKGKKKQLLTASRRRKKATCGGKGCFPVAPPAYLDYGGVASSVMKTKQRDIVMERLRNVDVVEELTYMMPGGNGEGDGAAGEDDDCDYFAVCESCGEMEPIPEELRKKIRNKDKNNQSEQTPVTYSRRQSFNFKNIHEGDDGPPYPYEGLQCPNCRCPCCVAGLRRNPNCECKCCQIMGSARKCNSFDEFPVGKNPEIRPILCPEEQCKLIKEECEKRLPEDSGMYKYDCADEKFERQVPRTPSPINLNVPRKQKMHNRQLEKIAQDLACKQKFKEAEPMYLPPIFGQCNPCYPPCCDPMKPKPETATSHDTNTSYSTGISTDKSAGKSSGKSTGKSTGS